MAPWKRGGKVGNSRPEISHSDFPPLAVTGAPPSAVMLPPPVAVFESTEVTGLVVIVASVETGAVHLRTARTAFWVAEVFIMAVR